MWFLHCIIRTIERFFLHHRINKRPSIVKSLLRWITFCQNSSLWPVQLEWVIASLSYASPFATRRLWSTEEGSTGEGNGNPLQYSCRENPLNSMKRQNHMTAEDEPPRSEGGRCAAGEEEKAIAKWCKRNEEAGLTQTKCSAVDVSGGESKFWCCKKRYCIGIWNVGSMNWTWPSSNLQDWMNMDILGSVN